MNELLLRSISGLIFGIIMLGSLWFLPPWVFSSLLIIILVYILCIEWPCLARSTPLLWLLTPLYPATPFLIGLYFNHSLYRPLITLLCVITITNDTGAYFIGKYRGRHMIMPNISPKKTWEGFWGGYFCVLIALYSGHYVVKAPISMISVALFGLVCTFIATAGDFFESWLKRKAHLKDTGRLLPGHGGLMDRIDSALLLTFLFFILKKNIAFSMNITN